jgi:endonuclease G
VLTPVFINGLAERKNNFKPDPKVSSQSADLSDYRKSGYDRGHLCPAAAMKINQQAMDETFYLSNMSPQQPQFNRGKWKQLEAQVRKWTLKEDTLHVVTGPILTDSLTTIGANKVSVPAYYYKVIYCPNDVPKMIAFIMPNTKLLQPISAYAVTVDEVELKTGVDFFSALPDAIENELEAKVILWDFN